MGSGQATPDSGWSRETASDLSVEETAIARSVAMATDSTIAGKSRLLPGLISASFSFRARKWWRRPPFLPLPDSDYTRWRLYTAYGDRRQRPSWNDVVAFSVWRQSIRRVVEMRSQ